MSKYTPYEKIASGLRELRKAEGLTQEELGERIGVSGASISRWESGTHVPQKHHLHELEDFYGLPFGNLVDRFINTAARRKVHERWTDYKASEGEVHRMGAHTMRLLPDGNLLVNGATIIVAPEQE